MLDALSSRAWRETPDVARRCGLAIADVEAVLGLLAMEGAICATSGLATGSSGLSGRRGSSVRPGVGRSSDAETTSGSRHHATWWVSTGMWFLGRGGAPGAPPGRPLPATMLGSWSWMPPPTRSACTWSACAGSLPLPCAPTAPTSGTSPPRRASCRSSRSISSCCGSGCGTRPSAATPDPPSPAARRRLVPSSRGAWMRAFSPRIPAFASLRRSGGGPSRPS